MLLAAGAWAMVIGAGLLAAAAAATPNSTLHWGIAVGLAGEGLLTLAIAKMTGRLLERNADDEAKRTAKTARRQRRIAA